jgi:hypothetical protein
MTDSSHRRISRAGLVLTAAGIACGAVVWQWGAQTLSLAQEYAGVEPIGEFYSHEPDENPQPQLGDVPEAPTEPRSLGDTRVRQYDELDRPRVNLKLTHRGAQINTERFTVVAMTGEEDAELALTEFTRAWDEFGKLADAFTDDHRNPDFGIGQLLIVIEDEPVRERDEPTATFQTQNGQTLVYINVAEGQPSLEEQLPELRQGAVQAMLHLAELDRKFPLWVQQGLAEYTAGKIEQAKLAEEAAEDAEDEEGSSPSATEVVADEMPAEGDEEEVADADDEDAEPKESVLRQNPAFAELKPIDDEYWRRQRAEQDKLADAPPNANGDDAEEDEEPSDALERVTYLLEGDDAEHAPDFLLALRELAEEDTDPLLASRDQLANTILLMPATDTAVDEDLEELDEKYLAWRQDPLRGQPLFIPSGDISDPAMLAREKEMEVVLKLAMKVNQATSETQIRPQIMEFGAAGAQDVSLAAVSGQAINVTQLYQDLLEADEAWATIDSDGELLLWTDEERLAEALGVEEQKYTTEYRDGKWVLVTVWDDNTQLEAWLEPNEDNPSRPLVKFGARPREQNLRVAELLPDAQRR